ncbi:peroxiredoxin family protein [Cohnella silvisoli]|uniref:TlpA disulfide reductase family protein n=1 Tax=Cohnella silvisoli TaxID=2873699 RepID=A0ABV1KQW2_9BACL|nr:TlpA disulfide reductase family protein [Cohnella silvisoli]MCD9025627.1 TlpA family protein disulfide reductase [Cohnella silvisoli]
MKRNLIIVGLVLVAIAAVWIWDSPAKEPAGQLAESSVGGAVDGNIPKDPAPKDNHYAPSFSLASLDGTSSFKVGGKRDKVLIVNFWAAWCAPCELEAPDLKDIYEKHKDKLDLYAVNATKYDKLREAHDFVKEQKFVFPVLTDAKGDVGDLYKVFSYPISFIIDRNGVIRHRIEGVIEREQWEIYLQEVIDS